MKRSSLLAALVMSLTLVGIASAHCQVPCGIYDDAARFAMMREEITTMEKSITSILKLSAEANPNYNQLVRWVNNKDEHADAFTKIVTYYFMAQRIKPADPKDEEAVEKYQRELAWLHEMIVYSMKVKQTTTIEHCVKLRTLVDMFEASYFGKADEAEAQAHDHHDHHGDHSH